MSDHTKPIPYPQGILQANFSQYAPAHRGQTLIGAIKPLLVANSPVVGAGNQKTDAGTRRDAAGKERAEAVLADRPCSPVIESLLSTPTR